MLAARPTGVVLMGSWSHRGCGVAADWCTSGRQQSDQRGRDIDEPILLHHSSPDSKRSAQQDIW
ncbi:hypothetical protein CFK41_12955 [Brachybacterium ginsengisoli]|uniref:Uncharacterized protein n=1 Tax=Brachybacterium ginsengisoli TaxID=1331682 RepID=A0A291GZF6_9MICO|nr:hypothetical protein CFK41_12955 [Brachybacterium ginsengisoli]